MIVMVMLCLSVQSAIALEYFNSHLSKFKSAKILSLLLLITLSASMLVETSMTPFPFAEDTSVPQFYYQMRNMNVMFSVLELPQDYETNNHFMYYSTISSKPIVGGSVSRIDPACYEREYTIPLMFQTEMARRGNQINQIADITPGDINASNIAYFKFFNIGYIIVHKDMMNSESFNELSTYLYALLDKPVYEDERITAFNTSTTKLPKDAYPMLLDGWWNLEFNGGIPTRWIDKNGTLQVVSQSNRLCNLSFSVGTNLANKSLDVYLNGELQEEFEVRSSELSNISLPVLLKSGSNIISMYVDKTFVPAAVIPNNFDSRRLSVFIQHMEILPSVNRSFPLSHFVPLK